MPKDKLTDYSATNASNTDVGGVNIDEGMLPSAVNNAIRELMTHQANAFGAGTPLYVDETNTRLGVNNASPTATLDVNGTIKLDGNYPVGTGNVALGDTALDSNVSGGSNTAIGGDALTANTASQNTAVGYQAGYSNTTGTENNALGYQSLYSNTTGNQNNAFGRTALTANTTGGHNSAFGHSSLKTNTTGQYNTAYGSQALFSNTTASYNTAVGYQAGANQVGGDHNTYIGRVAGYSGTSGTFNTFVGNGAGYFVSSGGKNTILGSYNGNQGGLDIRTSSNYIVLSDGDGNPRLWINNNGYLHSDTTYANTSGGAANVGIASSGQFYRSTSSRRYKNTINDATHGLTELLALRPVTYKGNNDGDIIFGGLIAEEVHDAGLTEFVSYNDDNEPDALAYGNMVSLCIKAIQEQQATITALTARIEALEA